MKMRTLESTKVLGPYHFVIAEFVSSLEKLDVISVRSPSPTAVKKIVNEKN